MNDIPKSVIEEASDFIAEYGEHLTRAGKHKQYEVYVFAFPESTETGFPVIYLHDPSTETAYEITGEMALDILSSLN